MFFSAAFAVPCGPGGFFMGYTFGVAVFSLVLLRASLLFRVVGIIGIAFCLHGMSSGFYAREKFLKET